MDEDYDVNYEQNATVDWNPLANVQHAEFPDAQSPQPGTSTQVHDVAAGSVTDYDTSNEIPHRSIWAENGCEDSYQFDDNQDTLNENTGKFKSLFCNNVIRNISSKQTKVI